MKNPSCVFCLWLLVVASSFAENRVHPPALEFHRWSGGINVPDPVAVTVDPLGRVYVTSTTRRKAADLDIREFPQWIQEDVSFTHVEDREAFLKRELAPGKMRAPQGALDDHNKDGSIDWKDLTVHSERIYQLRDTDHDGTADKMTVFAEGFDSLATGIAAGILYHDGWVYLTAAPDLVRLRDTDDDGIADERETLVSGFGIHIGYAGHDMHGPRIGPDGRIYWSIGDKGVNVTSKEGKKWFYPHEGCVMRCEPDGRGFEVFAHGLRNVQEIAFDDHGNLFGVDNDGDFPGERERLIYITESSDSGWRYGHQYQKANSRWMRDGLWMPAHPGQPQFITPPLANYSDGPAGFIYEPGTALGASLRGHFILNQFPSGRMTAFKLVPDQASFAMQGERLIHGGIMGIGLAFTPAGALVLADWSGGYPLDGVGNIWTADDPAARDNRARQETNELLNSPPELTQLGHRDQRVRLAAQFAWVKKGAYADLAIVALNEKSNQLARIHAIWGLGQGLRAGKTDAGTLTKLLADPDPEIITQAAKMLGDARTGGPPLIPLLTHPLPRVRFHAAIALGKIGLPSAGEALIAMAADEKADPFMRHAIVTGLAGCVPEEILASQVAEPSALCCLLALERQRSPRVADFLQAFPEEAERAIHDDSGIPEALPAIAKQHSRRGLNACLRLGIAEPIIQAALTPGSIQAEALDVLLVFTRAPRLDRIDGHVHEIVPRDATHFTGLVQENLDALLAIQDGELKTKVIELILQLHLRVSPGILEEIVADKVASASLRAEALKLLATTADFTVPPNLALDKNAPAALRHEALTQLFVRQPERGIAAAATILLDSDTSTRQLALKLLASSKDDTTISHWLDRLAANQAPAAIELDILEAAATRESLRPKLAALSTGNSELLEGGDVTRGRDIATHHLGANCIACHTIESTGGSQAGPVLRGIGSRKDRRYLLDSLLSPSATVTPGYGLVSVTLKDAKTLSGALESEDPTQLRIRLADGEIKPIPRLEIASSTPPVSVMPPMLGILTKPQIRDVVAYLESLKAEKQ